ncbi:MAG: DNA polymerase III subunit gamma/tau [Chitinophagaceae bacterium]
MDKFIVSARKYRPQTFDTVVGQKHITTTLKNAIQHNQLAHAFLFCGPRGVGKTTCARILAKTINCDNLQPNGEACDACTSCKSFNEGASLNIHELDAASNNSVDDIRSLTEQVRFAPQMGRYKVYIIDEVHMLSSSAFNAFLKTLEEPPSYAIFILATTEKHKILPTILSRCQIFDFKRITLHDTMEHLQEIASKESIAADKNALQLIAQKSEGCMRDALSILDKIVSFTNGEVTYQNTLEHLNILDAEHFFKLLEAMQVQDAASVLLLFETINSKGFEGDMVMNGFAEFFRNLLVCKDAKAASLLEVVEGFRDRYIQTAKNTDASFIISAMNLLNEAEISYKQARNKRLHTELALIKLTYLQQVLEVTTEDGSVKKKTAESKVLRFRAVTPIRIEHPANENTASKAEPTQQTAAKLIVEEPKKDLKSTAPSAVLHSNTTGSAPSGNGSKLSGLHKIRQKVAEEQAQLAPDAKPLSTEGLQTAWKTYVANLNDAGKHSVASNFEMMTCTKTSDELFTVTVNTHLQQRFLEQERMMLTAHVQQFFYNQNIGMEIELISTEEEPTDQEKHLSSREQYFRMAEKYPMVKALREGLNLDLEY